MGNASRHIAIPPGMVYTDTDGKVVYANRQFLELLPSSPERSPLGLTLEEALHLEPAALKDFGAQRERYTQRQLGLAYERVDGTRALALLTSSPAYDQRGKFVGMNIGVDLRSGAEAPPEGVPLMTVSGYKLPILKALQTGALADYSGLNGHYLELVLNALQAVLARMGGPRVREGFVTALAQHASRNDWPIYTENHQLILDQADIPAIACTRLIEEALNYCIAVVGQRVIVYEIEELYTQIDPVLQEHALQSGLSLPLIKGLAT